MANPAAAVTQSAVAVGLEDLRNGECQHSHKLTASELMQHQTDNVDFSLLEEAFGPESLGIIVVKDLPTKFHDLRHRLLSYSSALGNLSAEELGQYLLCRCLHHLRSMK
jgi:hypothetical protein